MSPRTIAWNGSIWLPNAPASRTSSTRVDPGVVHQQPDAGVQRRLGELDRADVVLGDGDPEPAAGRAVVDDVAERPAVGHDPRAARGERSVDDPVVGDDAGEEQLGDDLDDAGAADAGDPDLAPVAAAKPGSSDQSSMPMTRKRGSSVVAVDPDALDRARRGALARRDLGALEGRAGRRRRGEQAVLVAEHDLGVRPDVDDQLDRPRTRAAPRRGSRPAVSAPDVAGDARQDVDPGAGMGQEVRARRPGP